MLKKRLPPLEPLVAFEAAARLLSFSRAAEELHLSQAAISQQIRNLEAQLEVKLFTRSHRAVQLTNEGREYQHTVAAMLRQLAGATMDIRNVEFSRQLVIGCDQSFASFWLSPRLAEMRQAIPEVTLRIIAADDEAENMAPEIQVSVLHGDGNWPGFRSQRIFGEEVFPVCSPAYDHAGAADDWVEWILQSQLIDLADSQWNWMNWRLWLGRNGVDEPLGNRHLQINSYPLVIQAACDGQGIALGWRHLVDDLIATGRLLRPLSRSLSTDFGFYLAWRETPQADPAVTQFRDWIVAAFDGGSDRE